MRDGRLWGPVALEAAVSNYLKCDCREEEAAMVAMAADSKDQRPGAELVSQRRNLPGMRDLVWGVVQVQACAGGSKTQHSRIAWP